MTEITMTQLVKILLVIIKTVLWLCRHHHHDDWSLEGAEIDLKQMLAKTDPEIRRELISKGLLDEEET